LGKFVEETFSSRSGTRTYKVHVPRGHGRRALPLIVMLHGCTQNPDDFAAGTRMNTLADKNACIIVYPAQPASANPAKCWNWFSSANQQRDQGEPAIIAGITRDVMRRYRVDKQRVFIAGLSAGASMSVVMAATYPELYAAIGAHSGLAYRSATNVMSAFNAMRNGVSPVPGLGAVGIPIIVFHGDDDETVNPCNGQQIISQWLASRAEQAPSLVRTEEAGESNGRAYLRTQYCDGPGSLFAEHWMIKDLGHAWSGGSSEGSYADAAGPDASQAILSFFLRRAGQRRLSLIARLLRSLKPGGVNH
jgi:poly(hydroxyalkanoate) depolymerase family esterase